jgi:hypothetical protein
MPQEFGLHRLDNHELKRLLKALHRDVFTSPITRSSLIEKAFGHIEAHLDLVVGRDVAGAKAVVIAALNERDGARASGAQMVYCGVPAPGTRSRDMVDQVRDQLAAATQSVHVYGLRLGDDGGLLRTLGALIGGRDVKVRLVFDAVGLAQPEQEVARFVAQSFGAHPALSVFASPRARLRARVVVVDDGKVLLTSGELTAREEDGCIDLGVVFRDSGYNRVLSEEWNRLLAVGAVVPVDLTSEG